MSCFFFNLNFFFDFLILILWIDPPLSCSSSSPKRTSDVLKQKSLCFNSAFLGESCTQNQKHLNLQKWGQNALANSYLFYIFCISDVFVCWNRCTDVSVRPFLAHISVCLQAWQVKDSAHLPDPVGGVWGVSVCFSISLYLHRHALLFGCSQWRSLPHSVHHS